MTSQPAWNRSALMLSANDASLVHAVAYPSCARG